MNNFILISRNILRQLFRSKVNILVYFILPAASILLSMAIFGGGNNYSIRIGIVNKDNGIISAALLKDLKSRDQFTISEIDESQMNDNITANKLDCAFVVPEAFTDRFIAGDTQKIDVVSVQGVSATGWTDNYLYLFLSNMERLVIGSGGDKAMFSQMLDKFVSSPTGIEQISLKNVVNGKNITLFGIGFMIQFLLLGSGRTAALILKERQEKTLARIRCAPVKGYQFISSNVLINLVMITLQTVVALVLLNAFLNVDTGVSIINLLIVLFPLLVASIGLTLMLASFAKTERHLGTILTIVIYPTCMIAGCFWDGSSMPVLMQKIAMFTPQKWAIDGIRSLIAGNTLNDIALNILVMFAFAIAFFAIAIYGFNRNKSVSMMG